MRTLLTTIAFGVALAVCGGDVPATNSSTPPAVTLPAGPAPGADAAIGSVSVTVTHPTIEPIAYTIDCFGDTFTVTPDTAGIDGASACARLSDPAVLARLVEGPPADQICTEIFGGEDMAAIIGSINNQATDATIDRVNGCGIADWDTLLAGILPRAIGVTG